MATTVARLQAVLSANTRDFDQAMTKSEARMKRVGTAAKVGLAVGVGVGIAVLKSSVKEAMQAENAQARLEQAFKRAKVPIEAHAKQLEAAGKAAVKLGFDDEDLKASIGSLLIATGSYTKSQADANVAMDLARFKGVSLEQATKSLTMAMGGSQRAIKQLGIQVVASTTEVDKAKVAYNAATDKIKAHYDALGKLTPAQEREKQAALDAAKAQYESAKATGNVIDKQVTAQKVIDTTKDKVYGQGKAYSQTAAGAMARFNEQVDNMKEKLGKLVLPGLTNVTVAISDLMDNIDLLHKKFQFQIDQLQTIKPLWMNIGDLVKIAADDFHDLYRWLSKTETVKSLPGMFKDLKEAVQDALAPVEAFVRAFGKLVDLMKWLISHAGKLGGIFGGIAKGLATGAGAIGDADANKFKSILMGGGTGPKSVSPALYDELSGARTMGLALTSGYRPGARTKHGTRSDHSVYPSKAIDVAGAPQNMARFFRWLIGQTDVKQAFYDPLGSIFGGALSNYREGGHSDHVHVATYDQGGFLHPGWNLAYNGLGRMEPVGTWGGVEYITINMPNYVGEKHEILRVLQNWSREHRRRNGRSPF